MNNDLDDWLNSPRRREKEVAQSIPSPLFVNVKAAIEQDETVPNDKLGNMAQKNRPVGDMAASQMVECATIISQHDNDDSASSQVDIVSAALSYLKAGLSVIPIKPGEKTAAVPWKQFQSQRMTEDKAQQLFQPGGNIAVVGGAVSGHLECLDFDAPKLYQPFLDLVAGIDLGLRDKLTVWQDTPHGHHILYRAVGAVDNSQRLAMVAAATGDKLEVGIETRGEAAYFLIEPSVVDGKSYILHGDLTALPVLIEAERQMLLTVAKSFDERPAETPSEMKQFTSGKPGGNRPGDLCEQREDWTDLRTEAGWKHVGGTKYRQHWQRPGKGEHDHSISATLNEQGLFVFSTNAGLPVGKPINKFAFLAFTKFGGDFKAAAKALAEKYGLTSEMDDAEIKAELERLAGLDELAYLRERKKVAKEVGLNVTDLDKLVKERRAAIEGLKAMGFQKVEPHAKPQDAGRLMGDIYHHMIKRHIVCEDSTAIAATMWIMTTWFADVIDCAPIALITGPEKRCGKTQLLSIMGKLVYRPLVASSLSSAAVFRVIEGYCPTLLIDEADATLKGNEELRGVINSGHTRDSAKVIRCEGDNHIPMAFNTFGPKAIAGIGTQADTIMDRSIILELRRKKPDEIVARLDETEPEVWNTLKSRLARFSDDNRDKVKAARPTLPDALNDRERDNWRPLLAIAELAGDEFVKAVTNAALTISGNANKGEESPQVQLLRSIRGVFATGGDKIGSKQLVELLAHDRLSIWPTYNHGQPVTERQVSQLLKHFKIEPSVLPRNSDGRQLRGYRLEDFKEAFERYLPRQQAVDEYASDLPFAPLETSQPVAPASAGFDFAAFAASLEGKTIQ